MSSLLATNFLTITLLVVVFYLLSTAQALHTVLLALTKNTNHVFLRLLYEVLLIVFLVISTAYLYAAFSNASEPILNFHLFQIPLGALLLIQPFTFCLGTILFALERKFLMIPELIVLFIHIPPVLASLSSYGWLVAVFSASIFCFRISLSLMMSFSKAQNSLSQLSSIEAINLLPEGIIYASKTGRVIFMNDAMRTCLTKLGLPTDLEDTRKLRTTLQKHSLNSKGDIPVEPDKMRISMSENETRLFVFSETTIQRKPCQTIIALDVSEEEQLNKHIAQTNLLLEKTSQELMLSLYTVQTTAESEALIHTKARLHDVAGQRFSIVHRYFEDQDFDPLTLKHLEELTETLIDDLSMLKKPDHLAELNNIVEAFSFAKITLSITGELPPSDGAARAFVNIIREATTNAVRHANAKFISVTFIETSKTFELLIENDLLQADIDVEEGFGMTNMRQVVSALNGTFDIVTKQTFLVSVILPKDQETEL